MSEPNDKPPIRLFDYDVGAYGASEFATKAHLKERGFGEEKPHFVAYGIAEHKSGRAYDICADMSKHIMVLGDTRAGKLTTVLAQKVMSYDGPLAVFDMKNGELALLFAQYRRDVLGRKVVIFDKNNIVATALQMPSMGINVLDHIDPKGDSFFEDCLLVADGMIMDQDTRDPHWPTEGIAIIAGVIAFVKTAPMLLLPEQTLGRSLLQVRKIFNLPPKQFHELVSGKYKQEEDGTYTLLKPGMLHSQNEYVRDAAARILNKSDKERSSVISTVHANTHFLDNQSSRNALVKSEFTYQCLHEGDVDIFHVFEAKRIRQESRLTRILFNALWSAVSGFSAPPKKDILVIIEEMAVQGRLNTVEDLFAVSAGIGIKLCGVWQDLNQLYDTYSERKGKSMLANCGAVHFVGVNDSDTEEFIVKRCGKTTLSLITEASSESRAQFFADPIYLSKEDSLLSRHLIESSEAITLHRAFQIILLNGAYPVIAWKVPHFLDQRFRDRKGKPLYNSPIKFADTPPPPCYDFTKAGLDIRSLVAPYVLGG